MYFTTQQVVKVTFAASASDMKVFGNIPSAGTEVD